MTRAAQTLAPADGTVPALESFAQVRDSPFVRLVWESLTILGPTGAQVGLS